MAIVVAAAPAVAMPASFRNLRRSVRGCDDFLLMTFILPCVSLRSSATDSPRRPVPADAFVLRSGQATGLPKRNFHSFQIGASDQRLIAPSFVLRRSEAPQACRFPRQNRPAASLAGLR